MQPQNLIFPLNPILPKVYTDGAVQCRGPGIRLGIESLSFTDCVPWQSCLTTSSLSFPIIKMGVMIYVSCKTMCKLLFSIVGYVFHNTESISDSSLPTGNWERKRVFSLKNPKGGQWCIAHTRSILLPFLIYAQVTYVPGKQL